MSVENGDLFFNQGAIYVPLATSVIWSLQGILPHTTTDTVDGDGSGRRGWVWNSDFLLPGDRFGYVLNETGSFTYMWAVHPSMRATVMVTA